MRPNLTLLDRLHLGEDAAYEELVRGHICRMLFVARRVVGDEQRARLVVKAAFQAAFNELPVPGSVTPLPAWLHRHVIHESVTQLRARTAPGFDVEGSDPAGAASYTGVAALPLS